MADKIDFTAEERELEALRKFYRLSFHKMATLSLDEQGQRRRVFLRKWKEQYPDACDNNAQAP